MSKDNEYQAPDLKKLIKTGIEINYAGSNEERIRLKHFIINFHNFISGVAARQAPNKPSEAFLRDLCVGARVFGMENINQRRYRRFFGGSTLEATLEDQLGISAKNEISSRDRFIYISKLFWFISNNCPSLDKDILPLIEASLQKVYQECSAEADSILEALPTESALDSRLEILDKLYEETKKGAKDNEDRRFFAELGVCIKNVVDEIKRPDDNNNDINDYCFGRRWQLKMGTFIFFMAAIKDGMNGDRGYLLPFLWSPYGHSGLYTVCKDTLNRLDDTTRYVCLAAFRNFINDFQYRQKIREYAHAHYPKNKKMEIIDASLFKYEEYLVQQLKTLSGDAGSSFPSWALTFGILGAFALGPFGRGLGAAAGSAFAQTDTFVPVLASMSTLTRRMMHLGLGESGKNMAYKASELVTMNVMAYGLGMTCQAVAMVMGAAAGTMVGTAVDLSAEGITKIRNDYRIPVSVTNKDLEFVICMMKLPANILSAEKKARIKYNTMGMTLFDNPVEDRITKSPEPEQAEAKEGCKI